MENTLLTIARAVAIGKSVTAAIKEHLEPAIRTMPPEEPGDTAIFTGNSVQDCSTASTDDVV